MTWQEICDRYQDQWVLIEYFELDGNLEVAQGEVIASASSKDEIHRLVLSERRGRNLAVRYCGDWPTDIAVMFWLKHSR